MVLPHSNPGTNAAKCQFITVSDLDFANVYLNFRIATHSCHFQRIQFLFPMMSQIKNWTPMTTLPAIRLLTVHLLDVPGEKSPKNGLWNWEGGSCTFLGPKTMRQAKSNCGVCWKQELLLVEEHRCWHLGLCENGVPRPWILCFVFLVYQSPPVPSKRLAVCVPSFRHTLFWGCRQEVGEKDDAKKKRYTDILIQESLGYKVVANSSLLRTSQTNLASSWLRGDQTWPLEIPL